MTSAVSGGNVVLLSPTQQGQSLHSPHAMDRVSQAQLATPGIYSMNQGVQQYANPGVYSMNQGIPQQQMYDPSLYETKRQFDSSYPPSGEKHGISRFIGKLVLLTALICGGAVLARGHVKSVKNVDLTKELAEGAKTGEKIKHKIASLGDYVAEGFKNLFKKTQKT